MHLSQFQIYNIPTFAYFYIDFKWPHVYCVNIYVNYKKKLAFSICIHFVAVDDKMKYYIIHSICMW